MSIYYGSSGDIRNDLGTPTETEISASIIDLARKKATAVVDGMLESAFPSVVPWTVITDVPDLINSITDDIAIYYIRRSKHPGSLPLTEDVKIEYWDKPIDMLKQIQNGAIVLSAFSVATTEDTIMANRSDYTPIFDLDDAESWVVDDDLEDKISDSRK